MAMQLMRSLRYSRVIRFVGIGLSAAVLFAPVSSPVYASEAGAFQSADYDEDGDVDGRDLLAWQRSFGSSEPDALGDANDDGYVDGEDLDVWQSQYGNGATGVPEPNTCVLILIATMNACLCHRWWR